MRAYWSVVLRKIRYEMRELAYSSCMDSELFHKIIRDLITEKLKINIYKSVNIDQD
jgi:hypothetical protein